MMNGRPNDPEYCQNIYEAAKALTDFYARDMALMLPYKLNSLVANLKRALEGKESV